MSDAEIEQLIALGRSYKTPDKLWNDEFRGDDGRAWNFRLADDKGHIRPGTSGDEFSSSTFFTATTIHILTDSWKIASSAL